MSNAWIRWLKQWAKPPKETGIELNRRVVLTTGLAGVFGTLFLRVSPNPSEELYNPIVVRPPGSVAEKEFLARCIRCGECMKVCPTNVIQPATREYNPEIMWTPVMNFDLGYCEFECTLCTQVCPTAAIAPLELEVKKKVKIGTAFFDQNRCLPYAYQRSCIVCEEHCPIPTKAIWFELIEVKNRKGETVTVKQPRVDAELCTGCGICQECCPIADRSGVYVSSVGETRHPDNKMLLSTSSGGFDSYGSGEDSYGGGSESSDPYGGGGNPY
jgi:MauM/NapG family ferredoxin protein